MIDTYMDCADRTTGYHPTPSRPLSEDPRYWNGQLYSTVIDRMVAEAKSDLSGQLGFVVAMHKIEIRKGFAQARSRIEGCT